MDNVIPDRRGGLSRGQIAAVLLGVVVVCVGVYLAWYAWHVTQWGPQYGNAGAFGDAFGPVAGLLSTLALAAAVVSVFMQRSELELQRKELEETREVFREQQKAQEQMAQAQARANVLAEAQLKFDNERLAWESQVEELRRQQQWAIAEADIMRALEQEKARMKGGSSATALTELLNTLIAARNGGTSGSR